MPNIDPFYNVGMVTNTLSQIYPYLGLAGSLVVTLAMIAAGLRYRGRRGERYSVFNHFISELGEVGVSKWAAVFNGGLMLGGILLLPFVVGLGLALGGWLSYLAMAAGMAAAVFTALVGVYPMNNLTPHIRVALGFFRSGLLTLLFFSAAIWTQPADGREVPLYSAAFGLVGALTYAAFLVLLSRQPARDSGHDTQVLNPEVVPERPRFWLSAALEWLVFFTTILWFLSIALAILLD